MYVVQKILTNPLREPPEKKAKNIAAVKEILYHIEKSQEQLEEVYRHLSHNQLRELKLICNENGITSFDKFEL